jgi:non-ribosomal peptide synthetase component F
MKSVTATFEGDERATLPALIALQARRHPERVAVSESARALSFGELMSRSDRLAGRLRARGIQAGDVVALAVPRSLELIVACLAVQRADAVVLVLDPTAPAPRLRTLVGLANAKLSVVRGAARVDGLEGTRTLDIDNATDTDDPCLEPHESKRSCGDPAFLVFTSGSTGTPKGVVLSHAGAIARLAAEHAVYPFQSDDVQLHCGAAGTVGLPIPRSGRAPERRSRPCHACAG